MKSLLKMQGFAASAAALLVFATFLPSNAANFRGWGVGSFDGGNPTILCTTNGADWYRQGIGSVPGIVLNSVAISPSGQSVWIAGESYNGYSAIFYSADGGATWTRQGNSATLPDQALFKIRAATEHVVWAVGENGTVVRTTDKGVTWETLPIPGYSGHLQAVTAVDAQTAWVGGSIDDITGAVFHTMDGGAAWTQQSQGGITNIEHVLGLHAVDSNTVWGLGGPLGIMVSTNAGVWWDIKCGGGALRDGNEIHVDINGAVWAATDSTVYWSFDSGETWGSHSVPEFCMGINSPDGTNVWAVSGNWTGGMILHSPDAGVTWETQATVPGVGFGDVAFVQLRSKPSGSDYDGDGKDDLAVYDQPSGNWYVWSLVDQDNGQQSASRNQNSGHAIAWAVPWGWPGAELVPGDYDGDGVSDLAAFDTNTGYWFIRTLSGQILAWAMPWTGSGLRPVSGDYDADGTSDLAVYNENQGRWYVCSLAGNQVVFWNILWGGPGLTPVSGDYDGDGASDLAVFDAAGGLWYGLKVMQGSLPAQAQVLFTALPFGGSGMTPVPGDYNGDGADDFAVYYRGLWCIASLDSHILAYMEFGATGMTPLSGDYDGDGADDLAVYDQASGLWYAYSVKQGIVLMWANPWGGPGLGPVRR